MFVIADQNAARIGGQRRLAGAGEAEEDRRVFRVVRRVVGRAVHRHHALFRQEIVEDREDRFLVFARIGRAADQDQFLFKTDGDDGFRSAAVFRRISQERRAIDHGEFRRELRQLRHFGTAQQVPDEEAVPGEFRHHAHVQTISRVSAAEKVLHEVFAAFHVLEHVGL